MASFWLLLHLLGVVLWVGGMGFGLMVLRPSLGALDQHARLPLMGTVHGKFFRMVWVLMPLVVLSGYMLLFGVYGGFGGVRWPIHVMHLLGLVMAGIFVTIWFGPYTALMRALGRGDTAAAAACNERIRRLVGINFSLGALATLMGAMARYGA
jgi:uncharacterized membrane protein